MRWLIFMAAIAFALSTIPSPGFSEPSARTVGTVVGDSLQSRAYARTHLVWIYTPPSYAPRDTTRYDLLLVFDGSEYLEEFHLPGVIDSLRAAGRIPPVIAVLLDNGSRGERLAQLANQEGFVGFLGDELVPWIRTRWRVTQDPKHVYVIGSSAGGLAAAYVALERPDLFGNVLSQSGALWRGNAGSNAAPFEWLTQHYADSSIHDIHFVLDVGSTETTGALSGTAPSILEANRRFKKVLQDKGYVVSYTEVPGGTHSAGSWSQRFPDDLITLIRSR
jgi:enterochelin esterase-like enzyme